MVAAAVIGGAVVAGAASSYAGSKEAGAATQAANSTVGENAREFNITQANTLPQRTIGANAIAQLSKLEGYGPGQVDPTTGAVTGAPAGTPDASAFTASPGYQFSLDQGEKSINNSLVAQGKGLSGAAVKAGTSYAQGLASQNYNDYVNQLMQQAGLGSAGVSTTTAAGTAAAANDSQAYALEGNARASAYGTTASGVNNAVQGGTSNYLLSQYLNSSAYNPAATAGMGG